MVTSKQVTGEESAEKVVASKKKTTTVDPENDPVAELKEAAAKMREATEKVTGGKVLLKMERENASFTTDGGVRFSREHPYQLVEKDEVDLLLRQNFRHAYPEEMGEFYDSK